MRQCSFILNRIKSDRGGTALLLGSLILLLVATNGVSCCPAEDGVLQDLLERRNYMKYSRPVLTMSEQLAVHLRLKVLKVIEVDELRETLMANVHHSVIWKDYKLTWNKSAHSGLDAVYIPASKIWLPDIMIRNSVKDNDGRLGRSADEDKDKPVDMVRVMSDGTCKWWPTATTLTHCHIDAKWFPFDEQTCSLEYITTGYNHHDVRLKTVQNNTVVSNDQLNGEWQLKANRTSEHVLYEPFFEANVSLVTIELTIRRKARYYTFNFLAPCIILHLLSVCIFIIPKDQEERVEFGVAILLTFTVYQLVVSEKLPSTSDAVSLLSVYYLVVMVMCSLSIFLAIVVMRLNQKGDHDQTAKTSWKDVVCHIFPQNCTTELDKATKSCFNCACRHDDVPSSDRRQSESPNKDHSQTQKDGTPEESERLNQQGQSGTANHRTVTYVDVLDFCLFVVYTCLVLLVIFIFAIISAVL